jgi:transcription elongation factor GreA
MQKKQPEHWKSTFRDILFSTDNLSLLDTITELLKTEQKILKDIYYTVFSVPKQHQPQFQWMLKKIESGDLQEFLQSKFLPRLIDSLNYTKGVKGVVNRILTHESFDTLMSSASDSEAERVIEALESSTGLPEYKKKDFLKIVEYHFPQYFKKESTVIWTTEPALNSKKEELRHIIDIEIPQNKKDISRAREFGDLSENFEYKSAKEKQDQLYQKLRLLETEIRQARIIDPSTIKTDTVNVGTRMTLQDKTTGKITHYTVLGKWDSDLEHNIISYEAPLAQALLGKKPGDEVIVDGRVFEIREISRAIP